jgi:hypothetical protein
MKSFLQKLTEDNEKVALSKEIMDFLSKHGKRDVNEPDEWNSPDGAGMELAAQSLVHNQQVHAPFSEYGSGGYKPMLDQKARQWHDSLVKRIQKYVT